MPAVSGYCLNVGCVLGDGLLITDSEACTRLTKAIVNSKQNGILSLSSFSLFKSQV